MFGQAVRRIGGAVLLRAKVKGSVRLTVREWADGSGRIVEDTFVNNLQTSHSLNTICAWLVMTPNTGPGYLPPSQIELGTGTRANGVTVNDVALWAPVAGTLAVCDQINIYNTYYAQYLKMYQVGQLNGSYTELGLFDVNGIMWGHVQANLAVTSTQSLTVQWKIYLEPSATHAATITNYAIAVITQWLTGTLNAIQTSVPPPNVMMLGTGTGVLTSGDISLFTSVVGSASSYDYAIFDGQSAKITFSKTWVSGTVGNFTEVGLQDKAGNLWVHAVISANNPSGLLVSTQLELQLAAA